MPSRLSHMGACGALSILHQNAQTLVQQIAELMSAKGEDLQQILDEQGINAKDLADRLHLDNFEQLKAYEADKQKQLDGNKENTIRIVAAVDRVNDSILRGLGLPPVADGHLRRGDTGGLQERPGVDDDGQAGSAAGHSNRGANTELVTVMREGQAQTAEFHREVIRLVIGPGNGRSLHTPSIR